jgi:hypothetical protein
MWPLTDENVKKQELLSPQSLFILAQYLQIRPVTYSTHWVGSSLAPKCYTRLETFDRVLVLHLPFKTGLHYGNYCSKLVPFEAQKYIFYI